MAWDAQNRPLLLNPASPGDDPICYLDINLRDGPQFTLGWLLPRANIDQADFARAEYTIRRLKLNLRENLRRGRAKIIWDFLGCIVFLAELGPDFQAPSGYTVRQRLLDLLAATEPCLAPVRQILYGELDYAHLRLDLVSQVPELKPILAQWALPPDDCQEDILR